MLGIFWLSEKYQAFFYDWSCSYLTFPSKKLIMHPINPVWSLSTHTTTLTKQVILESLTSMCLWLMWGVNIHEVLPVAIYRYLYSTGNTDLRNLRCGEYGSKLKKIKQKSNWHFNTVFEPTSLGLELLEGGVFSNTIRPPELSRSGVRWGCGLRGEGVAILYVNN